MAKLVSRSALMFDELIPSTAFSCSMLLRATLPKLPEPTCSTLEAGPSFSAYSWYLAQISAMASSQVMRSNSPLPRSPVRRMGYCRRFEL